MYKITSDYIHFLRVSNKEEAIRLADSINGIVFIKHGMENVIVYNSLN